MAAIDFPNSPSLNQEFTAGTTIYFWDGTVWKVKSSAQPPSSSIVSYSDNAPVNPVAGQVWVESDVDVNIIDTTTFYTKTETDNALALKANLASPTFTGTPAAPTANAGTNTTQIATTAFVNTAITNLINGAPGALDTLDELAQALGDDSNFATTVTNSLAGKIDKSTIDAKGDLLVGTADNTVARQAVGSNGEIIYADSTAANGVRYQPVYSTGKNKIINGDFSIWQRGTSTIGTEAYLADRWRTDIGGLPTSWTRERVAFTPGAAPEAGYEGTFFFRSTITTVGANFIMDHRQRIEDVRTLAGRKVTLSFWAKADSARTSPVYVSQYFGSGGSADTSALSSNINLTNSWQRFIFTFDMPSISGKTIAAGNFVDVVIRQTSATGSVLDLWGVQLEAGNVATRFEEEPYETTLRKCQRYYCQIGNSLYGSADASSNTIQVTSSFPVTMRAVPSAAVISGRNCVVRHQGGDFTSSSPGIANTSLNTDGIWTQVTGFTGLTSNAVVNSRNSAIDTQRFIAISAEL